MSTWIGGKSCKVSTGGYNAPPHTGKDSYRHVMQESDSKRYSVRESLQRRLVGNFEVFEGPTFEWFCSGRLVEDFEMISDFRMLLTATIFK